MPKRAKQYIYTIVAAGSVLLACAAALWSCQSPTRFLACVLLTAVASTFKVKLPGMESCITPNLVPLLYVLGTMSWAEAIACAAVAGVVQTLWKPKGRPQRIQVFFNGANLTVSMGIAYTVSHAVAPGQLFLQLGVASVVYEIINTLSVSTVIQLITGGELGGIWRNYHLWTFPYHVAAALLAGLWTQADVSPATLSLNVLAAVVLYLMSNFYQELVNRCSQPSEPSAG